MRRLVTILFGLGVSAGFYMVLIDTVSLHELYAGAGVVLLATLAFMASLHQGFSEGALRPSWLLRMWRALLGVPSDIAVVSWEALRQLLHPRASRGGFRAVSFAGGEEPHDIGRRALSEIVGSLAPNTIVIGVDTERELMLVHQLRPSGDATELDVLRLG